MKIIDFIFCEDVRIELGNKHTLVGVYQDQIEIIGEVKDVKFPTNIRAGIYSRIKFDTKEKNFNKFELHFLFNGKSMGQMNGDLQLNDYDKPISVVIKLDSFPLTGFGVVSFKYVLRNEQTKEILEAIPDYTLTVKMHHKPVS